MFAERDQALEANCDGEYVLWFEADLYDLLQIVQILARLADLTTRTPATNASARLTPAALQLATTHGPRSEHRTRRSAHHRRQPLDRPAVPGRSVRPAQQGVPIDPRRLSLTERRILAVVADGAATAGTVCVRAAARETRPYLGDTWSFAVMDRMAHTTVPLLHAEPATLGRPRHQPAADRHRSTSAPRRGRPHPPSNGINRWIGGVHLDGPRPPRRWNDSNETITPTRPDPP